MHMLGRCKTMRHRHHPGQYVQQKEIGLKIYRYSLSWDAYAHLAFLWSKPLLKIGSHFD